MLERLFKSKTVVGILELLLFGEALHIREIARRIDITPSYVKKELENLEGLGIVKSKRVGNLSLWQIKKDSPIYEELKQLFLKTESVGRYLASLIKKRSMSFALIYGSFAKGRESERSDIDLLAIGDIDEEKMLNAISKAEKRLSREINYIVWSEAEFKRKAKERHHLLKDIVKNKIIMIAGDENGFRKIVERGVD